MRLVSGLTNILFQSTHSLRSATRRRRRGKRCGFRFNPRTPCGVRLPRLDMGIDISPFQSTHSLRSATWPRRRQKNSRPVSIHALLAECDTTIRKIVWQVGSFNPRTPCGVRQQLRFALPPIPRFQSTHSLRSATDAESIELISIPVSIHALLAECDKLFPVMRSICWCFNPRTPCGVRLMLIICNLSYNLVSIHALLAECDGLICLPPYWWLMFQSTHSLRSATSVLRYPFVLRYGFNPRTPCGVRLVRRGCCPEENQFQSTHSLRSAT